MDTTVVGLFNERRTAEEVRSALMAQGLNGARISLHPNQEGGANADRAPDEDKGIWASIKELFTDEPDASADPYMEATRRGGVMVMAATTTDRAEAVAAVMNRCGAVDVNQRASSSKVGVQSAAGKQTAEQSSARQAGATIPIVEEEMHVGKRQVQAGGVRVIRRVIERPVEAQVTLRNEQVTVGRRAVGRELSSEEARRALAQGDQVIETTETREEPVVSKTFRAVEEVVIGKQVNERKETVHDKVRRTDVEVQKLEGAGARTDKPRDPDQGLRPRQDRA